MTDEEILALEQRRADIEEDIKARRIRVDELNEEIAELAEYRRKISDALIEEYKARGTIKVGEASG
jgi:chromosome segregation ATPase